MRKTRLHARADSDLIDIWVYNFEEWDDLQAGQASRQAEYRDQFPR